MQGTVKYSKEYIMPDGLKVWLGHEMEYDMSTQEPPFDKCALAVHNFANGMPPTGYIQPISEMPQQTRSVFQQMGPLQEIQVEKEPMIGLTPESILSSPDLKVLETYRWLIKGKPELERAYILRHDQLTQKQ